MIFPDVTWQAPCGRSTTYHTWYLNATTWQAHCYDCEGGEYDPIRQLTVEEVESVLRTILNVGLNVLRQSRRTLRTNELQDVCDGLEMMLASAKMEIGEREVAEEEAAFQRRFEAAMAADNDAKIPMIRRTIAQRWMMEE